jgi:hypothetical protein
VRLLQHVVGGFVVCKHNRIVCTVEGKLAGDLLVDDLQTDIAVLFKFVYPESLQSFRDAAGSLVAATDNESVNTHENGRNGAVRCTLLDPTDDGNAVSVIFFGGIVPATAEMVSRLLSLLIV